MSGEPRESLLPSGAVRAPSRRRWGLVALPQSLCADPLAPLSFPLASRSTRSKTHSTSQQAPRNGPHRGALPAQRRRPRPRRARRPRRGRRVVSREARAPLAPGHGRCARCARSADLQRGTELLVQKAPFQRLVRELRRSRRRAFGSRDAAVQAIQEATESYVRRSFCRGHEGRVRESAHAASPGPAEGRAARPAPSRRAPVLPGGGGRVPDGGGVTITGAQEKGKRKVRQKERGKED
jgi:hypothetical protein